MQHYIYYKSSQWNLPNPNKGQPTYNILGLVHPQALSIFKSRRGGGLPGDPGDEYIIYNNTSPPKNKKTNATVYIQYSEVPL